MAKLANLANPAKRVLRGNRALHRIREVISPLPMELQVAKAPTVAVVAVAVVAGRKAV